MSADVPLLNDYKKSFVKRRMIQTFSGGLQVIRKDIPWWIIVPQLTIFLVPSLLSIPFTILLEYSNASSTTRYKQTLFMIYGGVIFIYSALIQFLSMLFKRRVASNLVIRLMEEPSSSAARNEMAPATATRNIDSTSYNNNPDDRVVLSARRLMNNGNHESRENRFENEEDDVSEELQNAGFFSALAWSFILPPQLPSLSTLLAGDVPQNLLGSYICKLSIMSGLIFSRSLAATILSVLSLNFLLPTHVGLFFDVSDGDHGFSPIGSVFLIVFCHVSFSQAFYSLVVCRPAETATFRALSSDGLTSVIDSFSRCSHCLILMIPHCILIGMYQSSDRHGNFAFLLKGESLAVDGLSILKMTEVCYIVMSMMPIFWLLGIFPPLEALVLWMVEQCQIFVFGGTATSSMSKSFTNIIASALSLMGLLYLSSIDKSIDEQSENGDTLLPHTILLGSIIVGYVLSLDIISTGFSLAWNCIRIVSEKGCLVMSKNENISSHTDPTDEKITPSPKLNRSLEQTNSQPNQCSGIIVSNQGIKKYFVIFFHGLFLLASICIVLYFPSDLTDLNKSSSQSKFEIVLLKSNSSNDTDRINSTSYNQDFRQLEMDKNSSSKFSETVENILTILGWAMTGTYILLKLLNEIQKVYCCFGMIRSPLYNWLKELKEGKGSSSSTTAVTLMTIGNHFKVLLFEFVVPLGLILFFKCMLIQDEIDLDQCQFKTTTHCNKSTMSIFWWILEIIAIMKISRWIWQNKDCALLEFCVLHVLMVSFGSSFPITLTTSSSYSEKGFSQTTTFYVTRPVLLLVLSILRDRLKQMMEKLYFMIALTIASMEDRASRRSYVGVLCQMNVVTSPLIVATIIISTIFSTPVLALFTLPLFFVAFPRTQRFWPIESSAEPDISTEEVNQNLSQRICNSGGKITNETESMEGDKVYYKQLSQHLLESLHRSITFGELGSVDTGNFFLCRHEDRIMWIQILEKGNDYAVYSLKGMELQETSCHNLEATRVDDIFNKTFDQRSWFNRYSLHTLTPLTQIETRMYSSSSSSLTGVIESPETLRCIALLFTKTIVWYLLKYSFSSNNVQKNRLHLSRKKDKNSVDSHKKSENNDTNCSSFETNKEKEINSQINPDPANDDVISSNDQQNDAVISFDEIEDRRRNEDTSNEISYYQPIEQILRPSSSIEAVNLNSWPTSSTETSPEQHKDKLANSLTSASATWAKRRSMNKELNKTSKRKDRETDSKRKSKYEENNDMEDSFSDDLESVIADLNLPPYQGNTLQSHTGTHTRLSPSLKRKGLLPPIAKTDSFIAKPEFSDVAYQMNSAAKATKSWLKDVTNCETKDDEIQQTPQYRSDWASSFSLPDEWVTKAIHENIASLRKGSFSVPMMNDMFENITKLKSSSYTENITVNSKEQKGDRGSMDIESSIFSEKFFDCCLRSYLGAAASESWPSSDNETEDYLSENDIREIVKDDRYRNTFEAVARLCLKIAYGNFDEEVGGYKEESEISALEKYAAKFGPSFPVKAYSKVLPNWSSDLTKWFENEEQLRNCVLFPAYRAAVKLTIDKIVLLSEDSEQVSSLKDAMLEIDENWYLGMDNEYRWRNAVLQETSYLFCVSSIDSSVETGRPGTLYRSRLLTLRNNCWVNVARLNSEVVKGLWASLSLELLYLTNDDDERYSIQAEERILRNLTVEAADPPLGYPAYTSAPIKIRI